MTAAPAHDPLAPSPSGPLGSSSPTTDTTIAVARGDGIGPEIMDATLRVLEAAGAGLNYDFVEIGQKVFERGITAGIEPAAWDALREHKVFLKAP
ncbi:MAG: isocitrate/isopropylmalate family dehydrogenase, partial [Planctomycetota bacterium]